MIVKQLFDKNMKKFSGVPGRNKWRDATASSQTRHQVHLPARHGAAATIESRRICLLRNGNEVKDEFL